MAITFIYPIKSTPEKSLNYNKGNKVSKIEKIEKDNSSDSLNYIMRDKNGLVSILSDEYLEKMKAYVEIKNDKVTFKTISSGLNCSIKNAHAEFEAVRKKSRNGDSGNLQYCIVQNFGTDIDPIKANEIGKEFANKYLSEYQCVVSTHINTGHVHNHIEFNATSLKNKKYNDCLKSIQDIRTISDELCRKYNLDVLKDTEIMNLIYFKDDQGNKKFYEPTERKNKILIGKTSDANDYINTEKYESSISFINSHRDELKKDIDDSLYDVGNYEELLEVLRAKEYQIDDKTKSGAWKKRISFKKAAWDRAVRDTSLGEEYCRESLTQKILDNIKNIDMEELDKDENIHVDMDNLKVIDDLDDHDIELEKILILEMKRFKKRLSEEKEDEENNFYLKNKSYQNKKIYMLDCINKDMFSLKLIREKEITSIEQLKTSKNELFKKRKEAQDQLEMVHKKIIEVNEIVHIIKKYNALKETIDINLQNINYDENDAAVDQKMLEAYEKILEQKNLTNEELQQRFVAQTEKYNLIFDDLKSKMNNVNRQFKAYNICLKNIQRIKYQEEQVSKDQRNNINKKNERER